METADTNQPPMDDRTKEEVQRTPDSICEEQIQLAERELSSFVSAVTKLYGAEQAGLSAQDWLDECKLLAGGPISKERNWRAVTIAASARLTERLNMTRDRQAASAPN